ncbi:MAG: SPFH domain-containing protein, partial [Planctomycetota bacterium]
MTSHEKIYQSPKSGWPYLFGCLGLILCGPALMMMDGFFTGEPSPLWFLILVPTMLAGFVGLFGLIAVQPNQARVLLLFGDYKGTLRESGFYWVNPFYTKTKVSLRVRNFETGSMTTPEVRKADGTLVPKSRSAMKPSKVNDRDGNPIEISAVVVWKVVDTAEALFEVDDYEHFVEVQSEAALRNLASRHPYDCEDENISLRGNTTEISNQLREDIQARLDKAGVETIEARISHLAYAPEIAAAMLQRQQAQAVVAARTKIVEGAVG